MVERAEVLRWDGAARPDLAADAELLRGTATWLRTDRDGAWITGLTTDEDVRVVTALLDLLATELPHVDRAVARAAVTWCRAALGEPDPY